MLQIETTVDAPQDSNDISRCPLCGRRLKEFPGPYYAGSNLHQTEFHEPGNP